MQERMSDAMLATNDQAKGRCSDMPGTLGAIRAWFGRAATEHVCPPPVAPLGPTPNRGVQRPLGLWWGGLEGQSPSGLARRALLATPALLLTRPAAAAVTLTERGLTQGGFVIGRAAPGTQIALDGRALRVTTDGAFAFGFGRDQGAAAMLAVTGPDNRREDRRLTIAPRQWRVERVNGVPPRQVDLDEATVARWRAERERLLAVLATDSGLTGFARGLISPATGRLSGFFGSQRIFNGQPRSPHNGLDFAVPVGTPILAAAEGRATLVSDFALFGNILVLDHGHGVSTLYAHLSAIDVQEGQMVAQGERVARSGATGRVSGPHLHFSLTWRQTFLDPQPVVLPA